MGPSEKSFNQVKNILGKLDRSIDEARNRRTHVPVAPAPAPKPVLSPARQAMPTPPPAPIPVRQGPGRAQPLPAQNGNVQTAHRLGA
jgi:hypothetical protein